MQNEETIRSFTVGAIIAGALIGAIIVTVFLAGTLFGGMVMKVM